MKNNYNEYINELYQDAELYIHEFMNYKDDIYFWPKIIKIFNPKKVLEVGIGNGRLIDLLHELVVQYDGIDFSNEIVEYCKSKFNYDNVNLYNQNLKECKLNTIYDLIILPFNVINNFYSKNDIQNAFDNIRNMCDKNTIVIIDTINPQLEDLISCEKFIKNNTFKLNGQNISVYENKVFNSLNSTCIYKKRYINEEGIIVKESILPNRIFFHQELLLLSSNYGFEIINIFGDYNFEHISNSSRKQILIMRRK